jgi:hypothetical protein
MAKKNFVIGSTNMTSNLAGVVSNQPQIQITPSVLIDSERQKEGKNKGLKPDEDRQSFVIKKGQYEKLQSIAYWERLTVKELLISILDNAFEEYEKKSGAIKPIPKRQ